MRGEGENPFEKGFSPFPCSPLSPSQNVKGNPMSCEGVVREPVDALTHSCVTEPFSCRESPGGVPARAKARLRRTRRTGAGRGGCV